jgi:hypothetical protein
MDYNDKDQIQHKNKANANNVLSGQKGFKAPPYQIKAKDSEIPISSDSSSAEKEAKTGDHISHSSPDASLPIATTNKKAIENNEASGKEIPADIRANFESEHQQELGPVKIHTSSTANKYAQEMSADAFTYGNNIYFAEGKYNPNSEEGIELINHELTHVIQQKSGLPHVQRRLSLTTREAIPQVHPIYILSDGGETEVEFSHEQFGQAILNINRFLRTTTLNQVNNMRGHYEVTHLGHSHEAFFGPTNESDSITSIIASFLSDWRAGTEIPLDALVPALNCINNSLQSYLEGNYISAFNHIMSWENAYENGMNSWNNYIQATIQGAEDNVETLQTISDVSLKISIGYFLRNIDGFTGGAATGAAVSGTQEIGREFGEFLDSGDTTIDLSDALRRIAIASIMDGAGSVLGGAVVSVLKGILGSLLMRNGGTLLIQALRQEGHNVSRASLQTLIQSGSWQDFVEGLSGDVLTAPFNEALSQFNEGNIDEFDLNTFKNSFLDQLTTSPFIHLIGAII